MYALSCLKLSLDYFIKICYNKEKREATNA